MQNRATDTSAGSRPNRRDGEDPVTVSIGVFFPKKFVIITKGHISGEPRGQRSTIIPWSSNLL